MTGLLSFLFRKTNGIVPPRPTARRRSGKRRKPKSHGQSARFRQRPRPGGDIVAYHGTPTVENAKGILRDGWAVGLGNAHGDGIYATTDINVAKGYAGANGAVLKLSIHGKSAVWSSSLQSQFTRWCAQQKCTPDMSAKTAFLLSQGYRVLRNGNVVVVLMRGYRNSMASKIRTRAIRVICITRASDNSPISMGRLSNR